MEEKDDAPSNLDIERDFENNSRRWEKSSIDRIRSKESQEMQYLQVQQDVVSRNRPNSDRPVIPGTTSQKLSFLRCFTSSPAKTNLICMRDLNFNRYFWTYIITSFLKTLPVSYLHLFLGLYASDHHLFVVQMSPLFSGLAWIIVAASFFELHMHSSFVAVSLDYAIQGFVYDNPWNTCLKNVTIRKNVTVKCLKLHDFKLKVLNETPKYDSYNNAYIHANTTELFQMAQIEFALKHVKKTFGTTNVTKYFFYSTFVWLGACLLYKQLFNKVIWKLMQWFHLIVLTMFLIIYIDLMVSYDKPTKSQKVLPADYYIGDLPNEWWNFGVSIFAESMSPPALLQILTSRSVKLTQPGRDSFRVTASNAVFYILRGIMNYKLQLHCNTMAGVPVHMSLLNGHSSFYLWIIYFSSFKFHSALTVCFYLIYAICEFFTMAIAFQFLIEVIVQEWKWALRIPVTLVLLMNAIFVIYFMTFVLTIHVFTFFKVFCPAMEIIVMYIMYPFGRLIEDMSFHNGSEPPRLQKIFMYIMPFYFSIKYLILYSDLQNTMAKNQENLINFSFTRDRYMTNMLTYTVCFYLCCGVLVIGFVIAFFQQIFLKKRGCKQMFLPLPEWGSNDHKTRQLRKLYNSSEYIKSTAPRQLSRHVIQKGGSKVYKINVRYS